MKTRAWCLSFAVITCAFATASIAGAQDTTNVPGVRLGLNYAAGTKPGVIVLPVEEAAISSRGTADAETLRGLVPAPGEKINFELVAKFGAVLLVRMTPTSQGMHVAAYDVARGQLLQSDHFLFDKRDRDWRFAIHGVSDQIEQWVFGKRGIAQTRIAYIANSELKIVDSDGAETRAITTGRGALSPAWSPTGESVVYTVLGNTGTQVEELDVRAALHERVVVLLPRPLRRLNDGPELVAGVGEDRRTPAGDRARRESHAQEVRAAHGILSARGRV